MRLFDFFSGPDINRGLEQFRETPGALLLDVREEYEYAAGHLPGSRSLPLSRIREIGTLAPDRTAPLFLYCLSGARSGQAAALLRGMGYGSVTNIGGISGYRGETER